MKYSEKRKIYPYFHLSLDMHESLNIKAFFDCFIDKGQ